MSVQLQKLAFKLAIGFSLMVSMAIFLLVFSRLLHWSVVWVITIFVTVLFVGAYIFFAAVVEVAARLRFNPEMFEKRSKTDLCTGYGGRRAHLLCLPQLEF
ncbi:MAG: hypothetical protein ACREGJ_00840 [Candidatus Saccharimonadales bacterium]